MPLAGLKQLKEYLKKAVAEEGSSEKISLGFAVGVFISFTPLLSIHTIMAIGAAIAFRLNKVSTVAGAWVNNHFTIPFVFYFSYKLGALLLNKGGAAPSFDKFSLKLFIDLFKVYGIPLFLGTTITGIIAAVISYYIMLYSVKEFRKRKAARRGAGERSED